MKFNEIFDATTANYTSLHNVKLPTPFYVAKAIFAIYLLCIWDSVTDILLIISLTKKCKIITFKQSDHMSTYYTLLTLALISSVIGILNIIRLYAEAISVYRSNKTTNKSFWNTGLKYVAVRYIIDLHITNHCTTEKKLRTFFVMFEDYIQFGVATALLAFFQDGDVLIILSWITSLIIIAYQFGTDVFTFIRGCCIKCCCKCCHCKQWCYDNTSRYCCLLNISRYCCLLICSCGPFLLIIIMMFIFYDMFNGFIGGTIYYTFIAGIHWTRYDEIMYIEVNGTFKTDPFRAYPDEFDIYNQDGFAISLELADPKREGVTSGTLWFKDHGIDESNWFPFWDACHDETNIGAECFVSNDNVTKYGNDSTVLYGDSNWMLKYEIVYYDSC